MTFVAKYPPEQPFYQQPTQNVVHPGQQPAPVDVMQAMQHGAPVYWDQRYTHPQQQPVPAPRQKERRLQTNEGRLYYQPHCATGSYKRFSRAMNEKGQLRGLLTFHLKTHLNAAGKPKLKASSVGEITQELADLQELGLKIYSHGIVGDKWRVVTDLFVADAGQTFSKIPIEFRPAAARLALTQEVHQLAKLHHQNKILRDFKNANVLCNEHGTTQLSDPGFMKHVNQIHGRISGTLLYLAPEILDEGAAAYTPKVDIWAASLAMCEKIVGREIPMCETRDIVAFRRRLLDANGQVNHFKIRPDSHLERFFLHVRQADPEMSWFLLQYGLEPDRNARADANQLQGATTLPLRNLSQEQMVELGKQGFRAAALADRAYARDVQSLHHRMLQGYFEGITQ